MLGCAQATFAAALTSQCGVDAATASNHFDAFCAFKDSPEVKYQEYCHACLAVLPGDRAAKIDSKHTIPLLRGTFVGSSCRFALAL